MARAASTAAGLRRTDISAVNANDVYAQKCSTLKLMCKLLRAPITDDSGESSEPMTTQQIWTAQTRTVDAKDQIYITETSRLSVIKSDGNIYVIGGYQSQSNAGVVSYVNGPMYGDRKSTRLNS